MNFFYEGQAGRLKIVAYETRREMGQAAARLGVEKANAIIAREGQVNIVFAAAPSQFELYEALIASDLDFTRVNAFHMDEYIGLAPDAPQSFGNLLKARLFSRKPFRSVHCIDGTARDLQGECDRYAALLRRFPPHLVFHGIGENGHLAFNDPPCADFQDQLSVKVVSMDSICRMQQVHDGCFAQLSDVPTQAFTLTVPQLTDAVRHIVVTVPGPTKVEAVRRTVQDEISTACPATCLRSHADAVLVLDKEAATAILPAGI